MNTANKQLPLTGEVVAALAAYECEQEPSSRAALLADPKGALEKAGHSKFGDTVRVRLAHNTADEVNVVIPAHRALPPAGGRTPLDNEVLDNVAGGYGGFTNSDISYYWRETRNRLRREGHSEATIDSAIGNRGKASPKKKGGK